MVTSIVNAVIGSNAAKSAARQQNAAASQATEAEQNQYDQTRADIAKQQGANQTNFNPYMQSGANATGELNYLLGMGGTDTSNGALGASGSLGKAFGASDFNVDPGYQFALQQGQLALNRASAAGGKYFSGGAIKSLENYNQGLASQQYQNAYDRYNQNQSNLYTKLSGVSGQGLTAAGNLGQLNSNLTSNQATQGGLTANEVGQNYLGAGNATAAGTVSSANAYATGINQAQQNIANGLMMGASGGMGGMGGFGANGFGGLQGASTGLGG